MPRSHPHTGLVWSYEPAVFFFISIRSKKIWLARETTLTQGNGLVNQVNPLGVVHTLTMTKTICTNTHSKIFGRIQNVTAVREVLCKDITISCPYYNLGIGPQTTCTVLCYL